MSADAAICAPDPWRSTTQATCLREKLLRERKFVGADAIGGHEQPPAEALFHRVPAVAGGRPRRGFPLPIVVAQHRGASSSIDNYVKVLGYENKMRIKPAEKGESPRGGMVYVPPAGRHIEFDARGA